MTIHAAADRAPGMPDGEACYRAVQSRDRRFDGVFYTAVRSTGIYCRPSCPARTPAPRNVEFHRTAASAQGAGFRACKRCLPDATPGSPQWDVAGDLAGRAMRLICDGVVDRDGVEGLAARLGYTPRHLGRVLSEQLGAGPLALARARRAQTARSLIESGDLPLADVAFASGFASIRQFNATIQEVYGAAPTALRRHRATAHAGHAAPSHTVDRAAALHPLHLRLAVRTPFAGRALLHFLARRAVPGIEVVDGTTYSRTLDLPHGPGILTLHLDDLPAEPGTGAVAAHLALADLRDTTTAVERARRLIDADADPVAIAGALRADPALAALVDAAPGLRVPGHVDGAELAIRTVLGQQISVARVTDLAARLVAEHGILIAQPAGVLDRLFPAAGTLAALDPATLPMPRSRGRALVALAAAVVAGLDLDRGADRATLRAALLPLPGIGPWSADHIALRALGDPDVMLSGDLGRRHGLDRLGLTSADSDRWSPWRSYALAHLWRSLDPEPPSPRREAP